MTVKEHSNDTTSLSHLCRRNGLTVKQLCEITDTPRRTLENWCHAHPARVKALVLGSYIMLRTTEKVAHDMYLKEN